MKARLCAKLVPANHRALLCLQCRACSGNNAAAGEVHVRGRTGAAADQKMDERWRLMCQVSL